MTFCFELTIEQKGMREDDYSIEFLYFKLQVAKISGRLYYTICGLSWRLHQADFIVSSPHLSSQVCPGLELETG